MPAASTQEVQGADFLQLAGHPLRWRLLTELARSDRTVQELTGLTEQAQSLVSYHLGKLREAGLVSGRRSSADGRDAYYTTDLDRFGRLLADTAGTLHPGLAPGGPAGPANRHQPTRMLFLCTGNSSRSQMAEALVNDRSVGAVQAFSAGSHPKPVHPNAILVMQADYGISLPPDGSKHLDTFRGSAFDWVITLCDRVREVCPEFPGKPEAVHWSIPDPAAPGGDDERAYRVFRETAAEIDKRTRLLLALIAARQSR